MPIKTKKRDNVRKYPGIGGCRNLPRNVIDRRLMASYRKLARETRTPQQQLAIIATRPGQSKRETERLLRS